MILIKVYAGLQELTPECKKLRGKRGRDWACMHQKDMPLSLGAIMY